LGHRARFADFGETLTARGTSSRGRTPRSRALVRGPGSGAGPGPTRPERPGRPGLTPRARRAGTLSRRERRSRPDEPGDGRRGLLHLLLGLRAALADRLGHAVPDVILEQAEGHRLERTGHRGDLGEDVDAVGVLFDHPLKPSDLPLDPAQAHEIGLLVRAVPVHASNATLPGLRPVAAARSRFHGLTP